MKTKERILHTSLEMFNAVGEPHVTTLDISNEMGISPGNLYYHYKGKDDIIKAIFAWLEAEALELEAEEFDEDFSLLDMWTYIQFSFEMVERYEFFYRDVLDLVSRYPKISRRFNRLLAAKCQTLQEMCERLQGEGILDAQGADMALLANNLVLSLTFWLNYQRVLGVSSPDSAEGVYQTLHLLVPFLGADERAALESISADYR